MSKKSLRLFLRFKMYKNGKMVKETVIYKKAAWWGRIEASFKKIKPLKTWLMLHYGADMINAGVYSTYSELKKAYKAFTEKSLIDYMKAGEKNR